MAFPDHPEKQTNKKTSLSCLYILSGYWLISTLLKTIHRVQTIVPEQMKFIFPGLKKEISWCPASHPKILLSYMLRSLGPVILMSHITPEKQVYTVLDLKDAFCSLPLAEVIQAIFAFKRTDPEEGYSGQLTGTGLP